MLLWCSSLYVLFWHVHRNLGRTMHRRFSFLIMHCVHRTSPMQVLSTMIIVLLLNEACRAVRGRRHGRRHRMRAGRRRIDGPATRQAVREGAGEGDLVPAARGRGRGVHLRQDRSLVGYKRCSAEQAAQARAPCSCPGQSRALSTNCLHTLLVVHDIWQSADSAIIA